MQRPTSPSLALSAAQASTRSAEAAQPSQRKRSVKSPARIRAHAQARGKSAAQTNAAARSPEQAQAGAKIPSLALTKPAHVRKAAAELFNRAHKRWATGGSAAEMRTVGYFLNMVRTSIRDVELEERIAALEEKFGYGAASEESTELPAD